MSMSEVKAYLKMNSQHRKSGFFKVSHIVLFWFHQRKGWKKTGSVFWFKGNSQVNVIVTIISISFQANYHDKQCINKLVEPKYVPENLKCFYLTKNSQVIYISTFCSNLKKLPLIKNWVSFNPQNPWIFVLLNRFHKNASRILPAEHVFLPKMESRVMQIYPGSKYKKVCDWQMVKKAI